ncbi:uncharacterized protein LOC124141930 isoform X2 [Haliotis rufescens]|uniref:uncharacterized protein LOC124141930 isoform X2 n=1 Tax=Haliotis rufescens TaxID=6454 RepID=UPI00201F305D|nr:uncharacterized protein LOC124141930 isoform X2 [Haliotis rufescens]
MRCLIIAALGLATLALVDAEGCQGHDTSTCRHESCDALSTLTCVRGTCTCLVSSCGTHPGGITPSRFGEVPIHDVLYCICIKGREAVTGRLNFGL